MIVDRIATLLRQSASPEKNFPATDLFNEGWMLRLILDWFSQNPSLDHPLSFSPDDKWFSEALLPTAFIARHRGDPQAEPWTHADGVVGNFILGASNNGDLSLENDASKIVVIEAKMFSRLSPGVKNADYFNQAARSVACIGEIIFRSKISPLNFDNISFFVLAPRSQIEDHVYSEFISKESLRDTVHRRVLEFKEKSKMDWFNEWFLPALELLNVNEMSWEDIVDFIISNDFAFGKELNEFYIQCIYFNDLSRKI